jgi:hypothetical protein
MEQLQQKPSTKVINTDSNIVLVFKTSLHNKERINKVALYLQLHRGISKWNVDVNDCDNVLRIASNGITASEVETIIQTAGFYCKELH